MDARLIKRIETSAERGASALFATAIGYAIYGLGAATGLQPQFAACAAGVGALAYFPCSRLLALAGNRSEHLALPAFPLPDARFGEASDELLLTERLETAELLLTDRVSTADELLLTDRLGSSDELLLTDANRADAASKTADPNSLLLDDILEQIDPDARVVRLFDRREMPPSGPTPGDLQSRIERHLADGAPLSALPETAGSSARAPLDASQALSAALAELRRALR